MWTVLVLFSSFVLTHHVANYFIEDRIAKEKQLVQHTAQTSALHFESKIEKYLSAADFLKNYLLLNGEEATFAAFPSLAPAIMDKNGVIQCLELAKDGGRIRNLAQNKLGMLRPERAQSQTIYIQNVADGQKKPVQEQESPRLGFLDLMLGLLDMLNIGE